jgi:hypothetical protein
MAMEVIVQNILVLTLSLGQGYTTNMMDVCLILKRKYITNENIYILLEINDNDAHICTHE